MTIAVGDRLPRASFLENGAEGVAAVDGATLFGGRRVVLFGVPGAYTGVCSTRHVPSFIRVADALRAKGVDEIACVAVNDPFVMKAWGEATGATGAGIRMLSDAEGSFAKAMGLSFDNPAARADRALEALCAAGRGRRGAGAERRGEHRRVRGERRRGDAGGGVCGRPSRNGSDLAPEAFRGNLFRLNRCAATEGWPNRQERRIASRRSVGRSARARRPRGVGQNRPLAIRARLPGRCVGRAAGQAARAIVSAKSAK